MLKILHRVHPGMQPRGFSLVEMMVAVLLGALVAIGAVSLIVAIDRSNTEMIQGTRLNQELRALSFVIGDELKRARRLHDPIQAVGQGASTNGTFDMVDTSQKNTTAGDCIVYGYQDTTLDTATALVDAVNNYQAIYLKTTNGQGNVIFATGTSAVGCTTAGTTLNSSQLNVTGLSFFCVTTTGTNVSDQATSTLTAAQITVLNETCNEIDISITAKLNNGDKYEKNISRTYVQQVFIRSGAVKTS